MPSFGFIIFCVRARRAVRADVALSGRACTPIRIRRSMTANPDELIILYFGCTPYTRSPSIYSYTQFPLSAVNMTRETCNSGICIKLAEIMYSLGVGGKGCAADAFFPPIVPALISLSLAPKLIYFYCRGTS
jgi:hypothetical protein